MNVGGELLRRQILLITLLVALTALTLVGFNLHFLVSSLLTRAQLEADAATFRLAIAVQRSIADFSPKTSLDVVTQSSGFRQRVRAGIDAHPWLKGVSIADNSGRTLFSSGSDTLSREAITTPLDELTGTSFARRLAFLLAGTDPVVRDTSRLVYNDEPLGRVNILLSLKNERDELVNALSTSLLIVIAAAALSLFSAISSARLVTKPLSRLATSISRIESETSLVPVGGISGPEDTPVDTDSAIDSVTGRLDEIGRRIAGNRTELREARGRMNQVLTNLRDRVLLVNTEGRVMLASPGMEDLVESETSPEGRLIEDFAGPDHPLTLFVKLALASEESSAHATLPAMRDSRSRRLAAAIQVIYDRGSRVGALVSLRDRDVVAKLENQIDYSERLADLAHITSGIAHEVKNPLNAMVIHLELLKEKLQKLGAEAQNAFPQVEILSSEILRLDRVVQTFLSFSRLPPMTLRPVDINRLLNETLDLASSEAHSRNASVSRLFDPSLPEVYGDADLLKQAFFNIVMNSFQAMERPDGLLEIETRMESQKGITIRFTDNGSGIAEKEQERVFQLYYTTKPDGNGIGLAQSYRAVQLHHGRITFRSEVGQGTTFEIVLPINEMRHAVPISGDRHPEWIASE